jgi:hypothetical protein
MSIGEWFAVWGWWLLALVGGGASVFVVSARTKRHVAVRIAGTTLGATSISSGIGLLGLFGIGPPWLILLYPIVLALSVGVWRYAIRYTILRVVLVAAVNWWLLLWIGFLLVTGGGGGRVVS